MSENNSSPTADFGFKTVPREAKASLVREVFDSVAPKYDIMNDIMSLGIHRFWKHEFLNALDPRPGYKLLDMAAGTGDISFGWLKRGGGPVVMSDINDSMLMSVRTAPRRKATSRISSFWSPMPSICRSRMAASTGYPWLLACATVPTRMR